MPPNDAYTVLQTRDDRVVAVLPNRLIVVAQRLASQPVVSVQYRVRTGSIYEQEHMGAGLSHYLEHLVAGGSTTTHTEAQNNQRIAAIGAQMNAFTSLDGVGYFLNTTQRFADDAIDTLTDWVMRNAVDPEEVARERDVIQREFEMGQGDPGRIMWKLTQSIAYRKHPARHPVIGYLDNFLDVTRDELAGFFLRMYVPNHMVCVVTGDIDPQPVMQRIAGLWKDVPAKPIPPIQMPIEPEADPEHVAGHADVPHPRVRLLWPGVTQGSDDDVILDVATSVLSGGESARLTRSLRDTQKLVTSVDVYNLSWAWGDGFLGVDFQTVVPAEAEQARHLQAVREAVLAELQQLANAGPREDELARVKRQVLSRTLQSYQSAQGVAVQLTRTLMEMGDADYLPRYNAQVQAVTAADVQRVVQQYFQPQQLQSVTLLPLAEGKAFDPTQRMPEDATDWSGYETQTLDLDNATYIDKLKTNLADAKANRAIELDEPIHRTLSNGLRVIVQRTTLVPAVAVDLYQLGGLLREDASQAGITNAVSAMLKRGTAHHTADALNQRIESMGASIHAGCGNSTTYISANALSEDVTDALNLLTEVWTQPAFDPAEWDTLRPRLLAAIDNQTARWNGELGLAFRNTFFGHHPWARTPLGDPSLVGAYTVDDLHAAHAASLSASQTVLAVTGDVDPEAVFTQAEALLSRLPADQAPYTEPAAFTPESCVQIVPTQKPTTAVQIGFGPVVARHDPDYPALLVLTRIASSFPVGLLDQALRGEGPGLVYSVGAYARTGPVPGTFEMIFNTDAEKVPEAVSRAMGVVHTLRDGRATADDLARAKARVLSDEFLSKQTLASRASDLALASLYQAQAVSGQALLPAVDAVTLDDLQRVAQARLINPVAVVLSPKPIDEAAVRAAVQSPVVVS